AGQIGRITTGGGVTEFPLNLSTFPQGITLGPDNALWFAEGGAGTPSSDFIGRLTFAAPTINAGGDAVVAVNTAFTRAGSFTDANSNILTNFTAAVDFGDGGGVQPLPLSGTSFTLGHVYATVGVHTVTVAVSNGFAVGTATFTVQVNAASAS